MIKGSLILFLIIINILGGKLFSQSQTDYINRKVNLRALSLIDDYRNASTFVKNYSQAQMC